MNNSEFKVSVITPVYNAEKYLRKAVESAVNLDEVEEVILIEDNSPDNSLSICWELEKEYGKIKLFRHPDQGNHGAGASRNLGIEMASCEFIAFLDADDYYLPHRFKKDKEIFLTHPEVNGVYHATGIHYYSEKARDMFIVAGYQYQELTTLTGNVPSEELFSVQFSQHPLVKGEFCTDAITLRKRVFEQVGFFNPRLRLQQDTHMWKRLSAFCCLLPGEITEPVAIRGVHEHNRMTRNADHALYMDEWWRSLKNEFKTKKLEQRKYRIFENAYFNYHIQKKGSKLKSVWYLFLYWLKYPGIIAGNFGFFDLNFLDVFGRNSVTLHLISFKNRYLFKSHNK